MVTTNPMKQFTSVVSDSTVTFFEGTARIGDALKPFDGASLPFSSMTNLQNTGWQNVLIYLSQKDSSATGVDMTSIPGAVSTSQITAVYPSMPDSSGYPLGVFTFHNDGTALFLVSQRGV